MKVFFRTLGLLAVILTFCGGDKVVWAEQEAAVKLKAIFASGEFYVEYKDNYNTRVIAEKNGMRLERTKYGSSLSWVTGLNPLGNLFGGSTPKNPEVMYKDGNYYQFTESDQAFVCPADLIESENLDPRMGWDKVPNKLALPLELAALYWEDPYRRRTQNFAAPRFLTSGKITVDGVEYDADRYASRLKTSDGHAADYIYELLYLEGKLTLARSFVASSGSERAVNTLEIKAVGGPWPEELFRFDKKTKLYAAGMGDMNDLLERPVEVGILEGL